MLVVDFTMITLPKQVGNRHALFLNVIHADRFKIHAKDAPSD